jgi:hypothetical protein
MGNARNRSGAGKGGSKSRRTKWRSVNTALWRHEHGDSYGYAAMAPSAVWLITVTQRIMPLLRNTYGAPDVLGAWSDTAWMPAGDRGVRGCR